MSAKAVLASLSCVCLVGYCLPGNLSNSVIPTASAAMAKGGPTGGRETADTVLEKTGVSRGMIQRGAACFQFVETASPPETLTS